MYWYNLNNNFDINYYYYLMRAEIYNILYLLYNQWMVSQINVI